MKPQREPRDDQKRDKDAIRRYEMGTDIDGDNAIPHIVDNVLTFHEKSDVLFQKPKFEFVFKSFEDLCLFVRNITYLVAEQIDKINKVVK